MVSQPIFFNGRLYILNNNNARADDKIHFRTLYGNGFVLCITYTDLQNEIQNKAIGVVNEEKRDFIRTSLDVPFYKVSENEYIIWGSEGVKIRLGKLTIK